MGPLRFLEVYAAVIRGAAVGTLAHFGRIIAEDGWPKPRQVVGFVLQLGVIVLVAALVTEQLDITSDVVRSATAAALAMSASEVFKWAQVRSRAVLNGLLGGTSKGSE